MEKLRKLFNKNKQLTFFFPIAFVLTIVPLIVRIRDTNVGAETTDLFGSKAKIDLFSQNKAVALIFFCIILLALSTIFFRHIFDKKDKVINSIVILSCIFLVLSLLSSIFSSYSKIAFLGFYDRAEGFITITCYMILFIYSIYAFKVADDYKYIVIPLIVVVVINSFIGLFQFLGHDLLSTSLGSIISNVNPKSVDPAESIGHLYGTLYHYNYVGSFAAIIIPVLICSFFFMDDIFLKLVIMASTFGGIWLLFGSTSRAGLLGAIFSVIFAIIIFSKQIFNNFKPIAITLFTLLLIFVGINFATGNKLFKRIPAVVSDGLSLFKNTSNFDYKDHTPIRDIIHSDKNLEVVLQGNDGIIISHNDNDFNFTNTNGENLNYETSFDKNSKIKILKTTDSRYSNISFRLGSLTTDSDYDGLLLYLNDKFAFMFKLNDDNSIHMVNGYSKKEIEIDSPETIGFKGKEKLASSRGYIWARTLPLLKDCVFLGKGPDTFVFNFPQNDLIGKLYAYDTAAEVVDKPHNLYIQTAFNSGFISLLAFLGIMGIYIVNSLKLYVRKNNYSASEIIGIGNFLGVIGYLFAGMFNDSVISVAPVFWIILGSGIALNYINKKNKVL